MVIFIQPHNFVWLYSQHTTALLHLHFPLDLHSFFFRGICMFMTSCLYIKSRTHKWVKTYGTCFSETGLICLTWFPQSYSLSCKWHTSHFFFGWKQFHVVHLFNVYIFFSHSSIVRHLGWIHKLAIASSAAVIYVISLSVWANNQEWYCWLIRCIFRYSRDSIFLSPVFMVCC